MKYIYLSLLNFSLCFLIGCKSIPMFTERTPNLLIGEIVFIGLDHVSSQGISFIGTTSSGMEIVLRNIATNEILRVPADNNGLFYVNLQEGEYWLDEIHIKLGRYDGSWSTLFTKPALRLFKIESEKVNNVGTIQWVYGDRRHVVVQEDNSSNIKSDFSKRFYKSNWNQREWEYKQLSFYEKNPSMPMYNEINPTLLVGRVIFTGGNIINESGTLFDGVFSIELVLST